MPITLTTPDTPASATINYVIVLEVHHRIDAGTGTWITWSQCDVNAIPLGAPTTERMTAAALTTFRTTVGTERVKAYAALQTLHPEFAGVVS